MKRSKLVLIVMATLIQFGCGSISHKVNVVQPVNEVLLVGVGDVVLKSVTEKNLPNAFGKADIFGRTTPTGTTTVIYQGTRDGQAIFLRRSADIETGATTMNSTPIFVSGSSSTNTTGNFAGKSFNSTSNTNGPAVLLPPNTPQAQQSERNANLVSVNLSSLPAQFIVDGVVIKVLQADGGSVRYMIIQR